MKKAVLIARILLGAALIVFGLNTFLEFMPPPPLTADGAAFLGALNESGYLFPLKSSIEVVSGVFILTGLFTPLGLLLFAPILVNILAFHFVVDEPTTAGMGMFLLVLELFLAWAYMPAFKSVLAIRGKTRLEE